MFPSVFYPPGFYTPSYFPRNGLGGGRGGFGGAGRRHMVRAMLAQIEVERSLLDGHNADLDLYRRAVAKRALGQLAQWELDKAAQKQVTEAAIYSVMLSEI